MQPLLCVHFFVAANKENKAYSTQLCNKCVMFAIIILVKIQKRMPFVETFSISHFSILFFILLKAPH